ncbi:MAG: hypothetical protein VXZ74_03245, partial [Pseudomonadota bacterium]|nr:hypothetical protein [Pseudomonadota bacterium]
LSVMMIGSCLASRPGAIILDRPGVAPSMPEKPQSGKIIGIRQQPAGPVGDRACGRSGQYEERAGSAP